MTDTRLIAVGDSAGGVAALKRLVARLPHGFDAAVLVVLHLPRNARSMLPRLLSDAGPLPAHHARDGETIEPGRIYIALPDWHLCVRGGRTLRLSREPEGTASRPAIDPLLRSLAREPEVARRSAGVLLTGADADGALGLAALSAAGGATLVQCPEEARFPQMPRQAIAMHAPTLVAPIERLAGALWRFASVRPADDARSAVAAGAASDAIAPDAIAPEAAAPQAPARRGPRATTAVGTAARGLRVLVVEDLYPIANELSAMLARLGHQPLGPVPSVAAGLALLERLAAAHDGSGPPDAPAVPDAAVLDVDLQGEPVWPLADALVERGVPIVVASGYGPHALPEAWRASPRLEKPYAVDELAAALEAALGDARADRAPAARDGARDPLERRAQEAVKNTRNLRMVYLIGHAPRSPRRSAA